MRKSPTRSSYDLEDIEGTGMTERTAERYLREATEYPLPNGKPAPHPNVLSLLIQRRANLDTEYHNLLVAVISMAITDACSEKRPSNLTKRMDPQLESKQWAKLQNDARDFLTTDRIDPLLYHLHIDKNWFLSLLRDHTIWGEDWITNPRDIEHG